MFLRALFKLVNPQPVSATERKPKVKRRPKAERRQRQTNEWERIGYTFYYGMTEEEDLDRVPAWLNKEWGKVRRTSTMLGGKWRISEDIDDPQPNNFNEGYACTGYFRNGRKYRYLIVDWEGMMGSGGSSFYRKRRIPTEAPG